MLKHQSQNIPKAVDPLAAFHPLVREWFRSSFTAPTSAQKLGWPAISRGDSTLILAPTGSGKTLAAFLWCINRLMFEPLPESHRRCRVLYISPLKALAVDVERNLRVPLAGIADLAGARGAAHAVPAVSVRTGDTPASERAQFGRRPSDILITTPESLYLLLTSRARDALRSVDTVIVDEIHALVPNKRGAHLALSLERLQALCGRPLQRIGLSATQRPLDEVARHLGGTELRGAGSEVGESKRPESGAFERTVTVEASAEEEIRDQFGSDDGAVRYRPVTIVDTGESKCLQVRIEVPVEDMAHLEESEAGSGEAASEGRGRKSIWAAIHPKLLGLVREHRSTLIFTNSRRLAERLAAALNELAGETLVRAHHGSIAPPQRREIEDSLKAGVLRGLVATSSLELGIDMAAVDLVVQIEAPPSVASAVQRIGRGSHQVDAVSRGIVFPKYRGDLVACAAATRDMQNGQVEATRYPRNPLDVLGQQIVAMVAMDAWPLDELFSVVRRAAPYADLSRAVFESVLDMLAGRYPSDEFAELRPRITWDRVSNVITAREGARRIAVVNGGTIPDRGLYGVFLAGANGGAAQPRSPGARGVSVRVGELDEEMVFESRVGETFMLGASTWRIEEITHDRVLVSTAPGEPGKLPFWHGDHAGRPLEFGKSIGELIRVLRSMPPPAAVARLVKEHGLDENAAENLLRYLKDQELATGVVPDDRSIVIERCRDDLGDWRVCVLTPLGGRIHAPWSMAATAKIRAESGVEVETMWTDDGFVVRFPDTDLPPDSRLVFPDARQVEELVVHELGGTALFAAKFREAAARALLLPRRRPGGRTPLWQQRKRAADLLAVASRFGSFPILLEAYRECLRDVFDIPSLAATLEQIASRSIQVAIVDSATPSPFAANLLFGYVANYIYDGDAPLAERRAQALSIDQAQLRELLGGADLRQLLDPAVLDQVESELQALDPRYRAKTPDALHDLLLRLGDLSAEEIAQRSASPETARSIRALEKAGRVISLRIAGTGRSSNARRTIAIEDAARYRDALGVPLPPGIPKAFLEPASDPLGDLVRRYARTHSPFTSRQVADRLGVSPLLVESTLRRLSVDGKALEGEFRPRGPEREWCEAEVLRVLRRRSLAKLRHEVEPVSARTLARLATHWQGVVKPRRGLDALLDAIESLEGAALPASIVESEILPSRVEDYRPSDLDTLMAAGEVVWCGVEPLGDRDGRIALFLTDHLPELWSPRPPSEPSPVGLSDRALAIVDCLRKDGASFFAAIHQQVGAGYPGETTRALWDLVWRGLVTNDSFGALRAFVRGSATARSQAERPTGQSRGFRSRRRVSQPGQGRWCLIEARIAARPSPTEMSAALARQLLRRYGLMTREAAAAESVPGGFSSIYPVLKMLEESGRVRRGYFVAGLGATQFALPAALDLLRSLRGDPESPETVRLAAADPANPYGTLLAWPTPPGATTLARTANASVILVNGALAAYFRSGNPHLEVFLPEDEPDRSMVAKATASALADHAFRARERALREGNRRGGLLIAEINGASTSLHPLARFLEEAGFVAGARGYHLRHPTAVPSHA